VTKTATAGESSYQRIYRVVARIPRGQVATYGQVAELAGMPRAARQVGYALAALRDDSRGVPWHRVLNARGEISARSEPGFEGLQRMLLEREGVRFDQSGRVALERVRWPPGAERSKSKPEKPRRKAARSGRPKKKTARKRQ
jgi:methylated-DNA-protein-cysteine methyltransferase-like protein